jgi:hypothetical protein
VQSPNDHEGHDDQETNYRDEE